VEEILALAKKAAQEAEVFIVSVEMTPVQFEANRLKHIQGKQNTGVVLRVIKDGRTGYASSTRLDDARTLVGMAMETARFGMQAKFEFPRAAVYPAVETYDPAVETFPLEKMVSLGEEMIARVRENTSELVCEAGVSRDTISVKVMNSRGGQADYKKTVFSLGVGGTLIRDTDMLFVGESQSSCHPLTDTKNIIDTVIGQLDLAREPASVSTGRLPVIFTPDGVAGTLLSSLMVAFNGKMVLQGASPVGKKVGQRMFDPGLNIWDDPTVAFGPGSRPCDDEGVASQRTALIEGGVVSGFLYDLQTAGMAGTQSTGSASRGRGLPAPAPSAFVIGTGKTSYADMLSSMKEGLVIEMLMGADQGNVLGGEFSGNVLLGYKVENGKIVGRVKNTMVSGNVYQVLQDVVIGREAKWVGGTISTPHIYCPGLSVVSQA
jgi:PmbA protein